VADVPGVGGDALAAGVAGSDPSSPWKI